MRARTTSCGNEHGCGEMLTRAIDDPTNVFARIDSSSRPDLPAMHAPGRTRGLELATHEPGGGISEPIRPSALAALSRNHGKGHAIGVEAIVRDAHCRTMPCREPELKGAGGAKVGSAARYIFTKSDGPPRTFRGVVPHRSVPRHP